MPNEQSHGNLDWWLRHPSALTAAAAASVLALVSALLWWHVSVVADSSDSAHVATGDFVFAGMIAALVVLAAGLVIARQRRE